MLKIFYLDHLNIYFKLIFINTISNNEIFLDIFNYLIMGKSCSNRNNSFRKDISFFENFLSNNTNFIFENCKYFKLNLKKYFCIKNNDLCKPILLC